MATDPQTLIDSAACYECGPPGQWQLEILGLLKQILLASDPMADTSPQGLINEAACYACHSPGLWPLFQLGLLKQWVDSGGGGSGDGLVGVVNPEGSVTADPGTTYFNTANSTFWVKASGVGDTGWVQLL